MFAHGHHDANGILKNWQISSEKQPIEASFLMFKNGAIFLEKRNGAVVHFPIAAFSAEDQAFVQQKYAQIEQCSRPTPSGVSRYATPSQFTNSLIATESKNNTHPTESGASVFLILTFFTLLFLFFGKKRQQFSLAAMLGLTAILFGFKKEIIEKMLGTDPNFLDSAFIPFKPAVATHFDATWFYVESNGIPDHKMMAGITNWQQQVPIPQCYIGANAWQIPLNPVLATTPVAVNSQHFLRGAIAIAANGLPIFNPFTNTGVDAFLDGQLDDFGGHCGRADDYHYHTAPLHLDAKTAEILPIAFALDGFAVFGNLEPNGAPMLPLDANHGHFDAGVYHYHGTPAAPYMIGNMVGKVTEDATMQIIPQAKASPIRPAGTPLPGAKITDCVQNTAGNGYILTYTKGGQTFSIDYKWPSAGQYLFNFISPTGSTTQTFNGFVQCEVPIATHDFLENEGAISVFPNPSTGRFSLKFGEKINESDVRGISIFDEKGSLVFEKKGSASALEIEHLQTGVYFLRISSKTTTILKLIKN
jgi:Secretion system C-terminal sorting domain/YHYH protein/SLA1 homology domain 1, SHD1